MRERRSPARELYPHSALHTRDGTPVTIAHLAAEYYPYARSGGLAEAVANLARFQSAGGVRSLGFLPLYRSARAAAGPLTQVGEPFAVRMGRTEVEVRVQRQTEGRDGTQLYFIEQDGYFDRERLYGDARGDYPDNHLRYACFALAVLEALPRVSDGPLVLHAHDWHAALALVYLRTRCAGLERYAGIRSVLSVHNAGYQGHYSPEVMEELGLPWELFDWQHLEWYGKVNLLKGGLVAADQVVTVSPNHVRELRTAGGGFGLQEVFTWLGRRFSGILNGSGDGSPGAGELHHGRAGRESGLQGDGPAGVRTHHRAQGAAVLDGRPAGDPEGARPDPGEPGAVLAGGTVRLHRGR
jgi:starch synthase